MNSRRSKIYGAMYGAAIGDALGYPLRKKSYSEIIKEKGYDKDNCSITMNWDLSQISADTQMTLFTANGILFTITRYVLYGVLGAGPEDFVRDSFKEWYQAQTNSIDYCEWHFNWIRDIRNLSDSISPSKSNMKALKEITNNKGVSFLSYGSGCLARTLPIPLIFGNGNDDDFPLKEVLRVSAEIAKITHQHPLAFLSCELYAYIIKSLLENQKPTSYEVYQYVNKGINVLLKIHPDLRIEIKKLSELMKQSSCLAFSSIPDHEIIKHIGEGWKAPEALAIALFYVLRYSNNFEKSILSSVMHSGNSPTIGAVVGGIVGSMLGEEQIPKKLKASVEMSTVIDELSHDMSIPLPVSGSYEDDSRDTPEKKEWMFKYVMGCTLDVVPIPECYLVDKKLKIYAGAFPEYMDSYGYIQSINHDKDFILFYDLSAPQETAGFRPHNGIQNLIKIPLFFDNNIPSFPEVTRWIENVIDHVTPLYNENNSFCNIYDKIYIFCKNGRRRVNLFIGCMYAYLWKCRFDSKEDLYNAVIDQMAYCTSKMASRKGVPIEFSKDDQHFIENYIHYISSK